MFSYLSLFDGPVVKGLEQHEKVYAENQPEYLPLRTLPGAGGNSAISRWTLTDAQRIAVVKGADIMLEVTHFGRPLQPVRVMITDQVGQRFGEWFAQQTFAPYNVATPSMSCDHPNCDVAENLTETDIGWLCQFHIDMAKEIMRGEQRLITAEERIRILERDNQTLEAERDQLKQQLDALRDFASNLAPIEEIPPDVEPNCIGFDSGCSDDLGQPHLPHCPEFRGILHGITKFPTGDARSDSQTQG
jgi:hypothetical protein